MKKVVFISGISSGFGFEIAKQLVENGHIVYGTIRSKCETPHGVHVLEMDLTDSYSIQKAIQSVIDNEAVLDVVINNAGMHSGGPIEDVSEEVYRKHFETNIFGFMKVLQLSLPYLRKSKQATLINFSSIGGLAGLPFQGIYSGTKFAIEGISQALRSELKPYKVNVVVINPGDFHTKNTESRVMSIKEDSVYAERFHNSLEIIENDENNGMNPKILAQKVCQIVEKKKPRQRYIISSTFQKLACSVRCILPESLIQWLISCHYKC